METLGTLLRDLAEDLDISPSDYQRAVDRYGSVAEWIETGYEDGAFTFAGSAPSIYPQGSIALGTIVRPLASAENASYDIDLVCEFGGKPSLAELKSSVGRRIRDHKTYARMLAPEGRRCWTVEYAEVEEVGFHIDLLPAKTQPGGAALQFTLKTGEGYDWRTTDPQGFTSWFLQRCALDRRVVQFEKERILEKSMRTAGRPIYASFESVPDQLVRSPLQRAIQVLKRHRDVMYQNLDQPKPISVIVTTLAARSYGGDQDIEIVLADIVNTIHEHAGYLDDVYFSEKLSKSVAASELIQRRRSENGTWEWYIPNPVNPDENFADKWHLDGDRRAREFFRWVEAVHRDLTMLTSSTSRTNISETLRKSFEYVLGDDPGEQPKPDYPYVAIRKDDAPKPWSRIYPISSQK